MYLYQNQYILIGLPFFNSQDALMKVNFDVEFDKRL